MKFHHVLTCEHLPSALIANSDAASLPGTPFLVYGGGSGNQVIYQRTTDNWVCLRQPVSAATSLKASILRFILNLLTLTPVISATDCLYIGYRYRYRTAGAPIGSGGTLVTPYSLGAVTDGAGGIHTVTSAMVPLFGPDKEFYVEFEFNWVNQTVSAWVDGLRVINTPMTAAMIARTGPGVQIGNVGSAPNTRFRNGVWFDMRDLYIATAENVNERCRLGPQRVSRLTITAAAGTGWSTSNSASMLSVLNREVAAAADMYTPFLQGTDLATALELDVQTPPAERITALVLKTDGRRLAGTESKMGVSFVAGEEESDQQIFNLTEANQYQTGYLSSRAPNGLPWNSSQMSNMKVRLVPNPPET